MQQRMVWVWFVTLMAWCAYGSALDGMNDPEATGADEATSGEGFSVVQSFRVPGASSVKFPKVAFAQGRILLAGTSGEHRQARLWSKNPGETAFGPPEVLGGGDSRPDFSTSDVFVASNGTIYFAWVDQTTEATWMRRKPVGQNWEASRLVVDGAFRVYPQIMASPDGRIFVVWSEDGKFRYRTSIDGGLTWSGTEVVSNTVIRNHPSLASGPSGTYVALGTNSGEIHLATWSGSGFGMERVSPSRVGEQYYDATIALSTSGTIFVAWRDVRNGIYLAERPVNGSWTVERIADGSSWRFVSVSADTTGGVHVAWIGDAQPAGGLGTFHLIYRMRMPDRSWASPIHFSNDGRFVADAQGAVFVMDRPYFVAAYEEHNPRDTRFVMVAAPSWPPHPAPRSPQGFLDGITAIGIASGWAFDPDAPNVSVGVHFYVDGPAGSGRFAGAVTANVARPDVNSALGITGLHGFNFPIPTRFRDGRPHTLFAHGIDSEGVAENRLLSQSGMHFTLRDQAPIGFLDGVLDGHAGGWALDRDGASLNVRVQFFVDGPAGQGRFAGETRANIARPDVNRALGVAGDHGYWFRIPPEFFDGNAHRLFVYALDIGGSGNNAELSQSRMIFR